MNQNNVVQLLEHMGRCYRRSYVPISPSRVEAIRALLVQELQKAETPVIVQSVMRFNFSVLREIFHIQTLRPVLAVFVIGIFTAGSLLQVALASLPGDTLYTVKLVKEAAQVRLAVDEKARTKLAVQFAINRADEVRQVVKREESNERKEERIAVAVAGLQQHVGKATDQLVALTDKKELANAVEEGAAQIVSLLSEASEDAQKNDGVVAEEVSKALAAITETRDFIALAANPPTMLVQSVIQTAQAVNIPIPTVPTIRIKQKISEQPAVLVNPAQSVFALPLAMSIASPGNLPYAVSVGSTP